LTAIALNNIAGLAFTLVPLGIGVIAERFGLGAAMWSLLLGPVALWIGIAGKIPD
jgi:FSR family fosmidomycin resistance protein-like MFS transporter